MQSGHGSSLCIKCSAVFEVTCPEYPALCCDACNHANEEQCECGTWYRPKWCSAYHDFREGCGGCSTPGKCRRCCGDSDLRLFNACDVCHAQKSRWMIGTGSCKTCKSGLYICDNCIGCIQSKKLSRVCAACRTGTEEHQMREYMTTNTKRLTDQLFKLDGDTARQILIENMTTELLYSLRQRLFE